MKMNNAPQDKIFSNALRGSGRPWALMIVVVLLLGWLLVSWLNGWFPFGGNAATEQKIQQSAIDSLTATGTPPTAPNSALQGLTAPPVQTSTTTKSTTTATTTTTTSTVSNSVLDSLTPKK